MTRLVFITLVVVSLWCADAATVNKEDGGYEDVVVAIGKDVVYQKDIIVNLKALFRKASAFLLEATKGKFYFKSVMISVPMSWPKKRGRKEVWEDPFDKADVQVVSGLTEPDTLNPARSFPEDFNPVRLPAEFLRDLNSTSTKKFGKPEYHLIHHWANHRYGVFAEHATTPDKEVYCSHGKRQATRCTEEIGVNMSEIAGSHCPKDDTCMNEENECNVTFFQANPPAKASIMFLPYIDGISQFCDNDTHNPDALNLQNDRYGGRSTWDVITKHDDFVRVPTLSVNRTIRTTFSKVQLAGKKGKRIVFVLDSSTSMKINNRIGFLRHSFAHLIRNVINDGENVAIVQFNESGKILQDLKEVKDTAAREALVKKVERFPLGDYTCIGCGLETGIKVLESEGMLANGGTIILISDGEENKGPYIAQLLPKLLAKGVIVHTFALGPSAEAKLQDLTLQTGGTAYFFPDYQKNIIASMGISFILSTSSHLEDSQKPVFLVDTTEDLDNKTKTKKIEFTIPKELGKNTRVTVFTIEKQSFNIYILDPTGKNCSIRCATIHEGDLMVQVTIPETEKTENWTVVLERNDKPVKNLSVVVMTRQRGSEDAVRAESCVRHVGSTNMIVIYSRVTKGYARVLKANVTATITLPDKEQTVFLSLLDNGKGADLTADDGEYAAYFTQYQGKGRYSVRTDVTLDPSARMGPARPGKKIPPLGRLRAAESRMELGKRCTSSNTSAECEKEAMNKAVMSSTYFQGRLKDQAPLVDARIKMIAYAGAFQMRKASDPKNLPPDRVRDLAVTDVKRTSDNIAATVSWTSTGAYLDAGKATSVDLRASLNSRELIYKFEDAKQITKKYVFEGSLTPQDPYSLQTVKVQLPKALVSGSQGKPGSIFLGLRTKNDRGKMSGVSNIAPVVWAVAPPKTTTMPTTTTTTTTTTIATTLPSSTKTTTTTTPRPSTTTTTTTTTLRPLTMPTTTTTTTTTTIATTLRSSTKTTTTTTPRPPTTTTTTTTPHPSTTSTTTTRKKPTPLPPSYTPTTYTPEPITEPEKGWSLKNILAVLLVAVVLVVVVMLTCYALKRSSQDNSAGKAQAAGYGDAGRGGSPSGGGVRQN